MKPQTILCLLLPILISSAPAQDGVPGSPQGIPESVKDTFVGPSPLSTRVASPFPVSREEQLFSFKFEGADLDTVMETYCQWTGKIYLKNEAVSASITLKASNLAKSECIAVVDAILEMNNIALVPMGEKFIKVIPANAPDLVGHGLQVNLDPDEENGISDRLITQIIQLKNVEIPDVQNAIQHLMHAYGKIQTLERSNCIMITDTETNVGRIRELIDFMDQASAGIESRTYTIKYSDASEIAAKLLEIISMATEDQARTGAPAVRTRGIVRARTAQGAQNPATQATISTTENSGDQVIRGNVKVIADERTNIIFIFSQKTNFDFFDNIIKVLDVEVDPAITFEVVNLEYADADDLAGTLNELVGAATGNRTSGSSGTPSTRGRTTSSSRSSSRSSTSRGIERSPSSRGAQQITPNAAPSSTASVENLSRLSEETRILADIRSNSVLLMGQKADIAALKEVIKSLDVMLEQVVIEAAIFEIGIGDEIRHGIDWLYKSTQQGGNGLPRKVAGWEGTGLVTNNALGQVVAGAFNYYQDLSGIDSQILINLAKTDDNARLISTPVIMTTDNTEASLSIGEQRPVVTSTDTYSSNLGGQRSNYEYKDIGIQLTVIPRINPQRFVVMEVTQKADQIGTIVKIDNNEVPTILNREFEASIAVPDGGTVVLGGLMSSEMKDSVSKIPILGDIPLIGRYLFSSVTKKDDQRELIVLLTPYVMSNMEEMIGQTERLYRGTNIEQDDWGKKNWSKSKLRQIEDSDDAEAVEQPVAEAMREQPSSTEVMVSEDPVTASDKSEIIRMIDAN